MSSHDHHAHSHDGGEDTYFLDQLCMVGLSAAFGAICLALYFWQTVMLKRMLGEQFHPFILGSGIFLLVLAAIRGAILWVQVGKAAPHDHGHSHTHDHDHETLREHVHVKEQHVHSQDTLPLAHGAHEHGDCDHGHCGHDHGHDHGHTHDHEHVQAHAHGHSHAGHSHAGHSHADHDHAWAPWRYVVMMIPVILFLLGLPNKGPKAQAANVDMSKDLIRQASMTATWLAMGPPSLEQLMMAQGASRRRSNDVAKEIDFKTLEGAAALPGLREFWTGKVVKVRGQFVPDRRGSNRVFSLARFRIQCCGADAVQLNVPMVATEPIDHVRLNDWIRVTGEVEFIQDGAVFRTILRVHTKSDVEKTEPDNNPYI